MIQRIQTLFLLGVVVIAITLFFISLSEKSSIDTASGQSSTYTLTLSEVTVVNAGGEVLTVSKNYALMIINLLLLAMAAYAIFIYKNRPAQIRLSMLGGLLAAVQLILIFYYSENMGTGTDKAHYLAGVYLVAVQVFCLLAARRFIRKDDQMVRAADRIR